MAADSAALPTDGRIVVCADLFLAGGTYLHLEQASPAELGWWLVEGRSRRRLTVAEAFLAAPPPLRHEVILEAERLVDVASRHLNRPDLDTPAWRLAVADLHDSIRVASVALRGEERMRDLGQTLADRLAG